MKKDGLYPRLLRPRIADVLADTPVVLIHGPRQCGKTTLARLVGREMGFGYFSFDDDVQRAAPVLHSKAVLLPSPSGRKK